MLDKQHKCFFGACALWQNCEYIFATTLKCKLGSSLKFEHKIKLLHWYLTQNKAIAMVFNTK